ncbi:MAG: AtpZ/AtpI family protein [Sporolactobacillus sp.]|jgi:hypothetical protein|nr:AtpZ/AtpI family protein [Sporolactobacillus sp.]MCI1881137.1 AtpZ/AtpI family protein [Sporolactobacillus sp.]
MADKKNNNPLQMAAVVSAMGFELFAFVIVGALTGKYLQGRFGPSRVWIPVCAVAGFFFGLFSCFMTLKSFMKE